MQTYNVFANMDILKAAGIKAPTAKSPWTWQQFRTISKRLTNANRFGVCWGLRSPTAAIQTMALNYGGQYFYLENGKWNFKHGAAEQAVVKKIHDMIHVDKSVDAAATGLSGSAVLPAFFGGKCAMTVQGNFPAQGMILQGPTRLQLGDVPAPQGHEPEPGREPADALDLAAEQVQAGGDAVHRVLRRTREPREARARATG